jgi:hypothetical protein
MLINKTVGAISLGYLNDTTDFQKPEGSSQSTNRIFQLGKGNIAARSNAITILRNGNTGLGTVNPSKILEVIGVSSATPVTLVIGNKSGFGTASLEFLSNYELASRWRPG